MKEEFPDQGISKQQLVLGTHTSEGEQNYLMRAEVTLPLEDTETDNRCVGCRVSRAECRVLRCAKPHVLRRALEGMGPVAT